jgi:hypothetical protein
MKRSLLVLGIVGLTVVVAALLFRLLAPHPTDVSVGVDAGLRAEVLDAGVGADAGVAPKKEVDLASLPKNPKVTLALRHESSFATPRQALEQLAYEQRMPSEYQADAGVKTLTLPAGIYESDLPIVEVTDLRVVAEGGPVVFRGTGSRPELLSIIRSQKIVLEGVILFDPVDPPDAPPIRPMFVLDSKDITLSRVAASSSTTCLSMRGGDSVVLSDVVLGPCARGLYVDASSGIRLEKTRIAAEAVAITAGEVDVLDLSETTAWSGLHLGTDVATGPAVRLERSVLVMHPSQSVSWETDGGVDEPELQAPPSHAQLVTWVRAASEQNRSTLASWEGASFRPEEEEAAEDEARAEESTDADGGSEPAPHDAGDDAPARHVGLEVLPPSLLPSWLPDWRHRAPPRVTAVASEDPTLVGPGSYAVCGGDGPLVTYDAPDGEPTGMIPSCSYYSDPGSQPEAMELGQPKNGWMPVGERFIRTDQLHVVPMIRTSDLIIPLPLFKASVTLDETGRSIRVRGVRDACSGETCTMEDGEETKSEPDWEEVTIELPRQVRQDELEVQEHWSPECCT